MNSNQLIEILESSKEFLEDLKINKFIYKPSVEGLTNYGNNLKLGFSTFALKLHYMLGSWEDFDTETKNEWAKFINSFQKIQEPFPENSYIDSTLVDYYKNFNLKEDLKNTIKVVSNNFFGKNFDTKKIKLFNSVNAESKQAISTLYQVDYKNEKILKSRFAEIADLKNYLVNLDWSKPWNAGAQFSSLCVYSETQLYKHSEELYSFVSEIVDSNTGSYFLGNPNHSREIINGAMKVLSGLDWINYEIHFPEKLIDYCISNKPIHEGCDIVDYVYVLYRCSNQTNHRKAEVVNILEECSKNLLKLYHPNIKGFSYFENQSQTHYYGVPITFGKNTADIHGTVLSVWAIIMILKINEILDNKYKIIKP